MATARARRGTALLLDLRPPSGEAPPPRPDLHHRPGGGRVRRDQQTRQTWTPLLADHQQTQPWPVASLQRSSTQPWPVASLRRSSTRQAWTPVQTHHRPTQPWPVASLRLSSSGCQHTPHWRPLRSPLAEVLAAEWAAREPRAATLQSRRLGDGRRQQQGRLGEGRWRRRLVCGAVQRHKRRRRTGSPQHLRSP